MKGLKWFLLLAGVWMIGLGITVLFRPLEGIIRLALLFGIGMLVSGISEMVAYFGAEKDDRSGMMLASGIITALFSIWVIFGRGTYAFTYILLFIFASWVMASGIIRIMAVVAKKPVAKMEGNMATIAYERSINGWGLLLGILATLFGFSLMFNPFMSAIIITWVMSIMFLTYGVSSIELFFHLRKVEKEEK